MADLVLAASVYGSNADLIAAARQLGHLDDDWEVLDATYGKGTFWRRFRPRVLVTNDLYEPGSTFAYDFRRFPTDWHGRFDATVLDPPYGLRGTINPTNGGYGLGPAYVPVEERLRLIEDGIFECGWVTKPGGRLLLKCQDQVCNGEMHWQTFRFVERAVRCGMTLVEKLDMLPKTRGGRTQPARSRKDGRPSVQEHARGRPSSLLIFRVGPRPMDGVER